MVSGQECPFCQDIHLDVNQFSFKVAELKQGIVRLPRNQFMRGYVIVALKKHANELFELNQNELAEYSEDIAMVAKAVKDVTNAVKINYAIYGNLCPHVHCHIFPQQLENDPHAPILAEENAVQLQDEEYRLLIERINNALS